MSQLNIDRICSSIVENNICTPNKLLTLKQHFSADINSERRFERIESISELISILKKRDALDDKCLKHMLQVLNVNNLCNNTPNTIVNQDVLTIEPKEVKEKAYHLISTSIGHKWMDFGRALDIREGDIDELEMQHKSIRDRVLKMLKYYESNCDERKWKSGLLQALSTARRNDLRKQVQELFDIFN